MFVGSNLWCPITPIMVTATLLVSLCVCSLWGCSPNWRLISDMGHTWAGCSSSSGSSSSCQISSGGTNTSSLVTHSVRSSQILPVLFISWYLLFCCHSQKGLECFQVLCFQHRKDVKFHTMVTYTYKVLPILLDFI